MYTLIIAFAINTFLLLFTFYLLKKKSYKTNEDILVVSSEAPITVILAVFCLGLAYFLLISKLIDPTIAGTDLKSYLLIFAFSVINALVGCFALLYTYMKKFLILPDRLVSVNIFGIPSNFFWEDIVTVRVPMLSKNITIKGKSSSCTIHNGNQKQYKNFIEVLKDHIPRSSGRDTVNNLYNRL